MSTLHTESWGAFGRYNGDELNNATGNGARAAYAASVRGYGYDFAAPTANNIGWLVKADSVAPERWAYTFSSSGNTNEGAGVRMKMPSTPGVLIFGFSLFVPSEYVPNTTQTPEYPMMQVFSLPAATAWTAPAGRTEASGELFRIDWGLRVRRGINAIENSKAIVPGKLAYIECRISATDVRVWMDNTLVHQSNRTVSRESIAFMCTSWNGYVAGNSMNGAPGRWQISNMYFLAEDSVSPNVRLGPATRVIASRPVADVAVQFGRPGGTPSNASVAASDYSATKVDTLAIRAINNSDLYSVNAADAVTGAAAVHAVAVKSLVSNVEADPHAVKPLIVSNSVEADVVPASYAVAPLAGYKMAYASTRVDPATGNAWVPSAAAAVRAGLRLIS